ncbi:hypothetical protein [uncultured Prevotella sp.]|uniref:hypothetical protein n=1 Tax=uncultured Prevotella sp. TaxID=159272 RepID=UPI002804EE88|nr:hypothetical protein [uncultured Prevotella sp.]
MEKKIFLFASILGILALSSCSQESEESQEQQRKELRSSSSIKELTEQLKAYNSQFYIQNEEQTAVARLPKITYSKLDMVKIAISDCKGAIRGSGGAIGGMIVGAASSSLIKFATMTAKKLIIAYWKEHHPHKVYGMNNIYAYSDSIGIYHNAIEYSIYSGNRDCYKLPSVNIVRDAHTRLQSMSSGYIKAGMLTSPDMRHLAIDIDNVRKIDESQYTFPEYCEKLKELNPEDSDCIDFCAEYIYAAVYANLTNLDDYTGKVIYQIRNSNAAVKDKDLLYGLVQVAYASVLFSQNLQFQSVSNN